MQIKMEWNKWVCIWSYHKCLQLLIINIMRNIIVLLVGTKNLRFPQKWQGVIFDPLLSVLGVIVIFSAWITQKRTLDWTLLHPFTTSVARLHRVTTTEHVTDVNNRVPASTRNDVILSVDASKVYFVASLLTQYWLACKLTCTKVILIRTNQWQT